MQIVEELSPLTPEKDTILTIGVFDGVHLGHQSLIRYTVQRARERALLSGVVTFHPHPMEILSPQAKPSYLIPFEERIKIIKGLGVDFIAPISFTAELSQLRAREFTSLLCSHLRMKEMVVGEDFVLGRGREGTVPVLQGIALEQGFAVVVRSPIKLSDQVISSTGIRKALSRGDVAGAARLLGRPVSLQGQIVSASKRGKSLGFPTANIAVRPDLTLPADGVYATRAYLRETPYLAITNIGIRPTFGENVRRIEVYILDFQEDIYGELLHIELVHRLRGEHAFPTVADLVAQMQQDVEEARRILRGKP